MTIVLLDRFVDKDEIPRPLSSFTEALRRDPTNKLPGLLNDMWTLADRFKSLSGPDELYYILSQFRRSYATTQFFEDALNLLDEDERRNIGRLLYQVIEREWQRDVATVTTTSAIITRLAPHLSHDLYISSFNARLEKLIPDAEPSLVSVIEPLSFASMAAQGRAGSFIANAKRMINDLQWRQEDYQDQIRYFGGVGQLALNIQRHMRLRPQELHLHDVGRVISIYQDLVKRPGYQKLAYQLKQEALAAVGNHGMGSAITGELEDLIERAAGWTAPHNFVRFFKGKYNKSELDQRISYNDILETNSFPQVENPNLLNRICAVLAEEGMSEHETQTLTQLIGIARTNPQAALTAVRSAIQAPADPAVQLLNSCAEPAPLSIPSTWDEAKAAVPGLTKFSEAKFTNPKLTIIDHLRDEQRGYGRWTRQAPGLPRGLLYDLDQQAHKGLYNWLAKTNPETGKRNEIPNDMRLPTRSDQASRLLEALPISQDEIRRLGRAVERRERGASIKSNQVDKILESLTISQDQLRRLGRVVESRTQRKRQRSEEQT